MRARGATIALLAITATLLPQPADAAMSTVGSWRRWPWRNGTTETLTQVGGHSYASPSARKAIDVGMRYERVHAIGPGTVVTVSTDRAAGNYIQVQSDDGTVITYEHLARLDTRVGTTLWMGDPIAVSGATGNVTGPHLHFQRSQTTSFGSRALDLTPIDGVYDPVTGATYRSDNAGIGTTITGVKDAAIRAAYTRVGGHSGIGVPQTLTPARTPCWTRSQAPTRWTYACFGGNVQTFEKGSTDHLLLSRNGAAFKVTDRIHIAIVSRIDEVEVLAKVGYPTGDAVVHTHAITQLFERGRISHEPGACRVKVTFSDGTSRWVTVC